MQQKAIIILEKETICIILVYYRKSTLEFAYLKNLQGMFITTTVALQVFTALFQFNPFPNKPWYLHVCSTSLLKTLWEKKKLLVMSNVCFSHNVFYTFEELSAIFQLHIYSSSKTALISFFRNKIKSHMKISFFGFHLLETHIQHKW